MENPTRKPTVRSRPKAQPKARPRAATNPLERGPAKGPSPYERINNVKEGPAPDRVRGFSEKTKFNPTKIGAEEAERYMRPQKPPAKPKPRNVSSSNARTAAGESSATKDIKPRLRTYRQDALPKNRDIAKPRASSASPYRVPDTRVEKEIGRGPGIKPEKPRLSAPQAKLERPPSPYRNLGASEAERYLRPQTPAPSTLAPQRGLPPEVARAKFPGTAPLANAKSMPVPAANRGIAPLLGRAAGVAGLALTPSELGDDSMEPIIREQEDLDIANRIATMKPKIPTGMLPEVAPLPKAPAKPKIAAKPIQKAATRAAQSADEAFLNDLRESAKKMKSEIGGMSEATGRLRSALSPEERAITQGKLEAAGMKKGGAVKKSRDGLAQRGKTKGTMR